MSASRARSGIMSDQFVQRGRWRMMSMLDNDPGLHIRVELELQPDDAGTVRLSLTSSESAELAYWLLASARDAAQQNHVGP